MSYLTTVVAYDFKAERYCPYCIVEVLIDAGLAAPAARDMDVDHVLTQVAEANGIDWTDEHTYDSDDFPKVVFGENIYGTENCGTCGREI